MTGGIHDENGSFICPECGHNESKEIEYVSITPKRDDPWSRVMEIMICGKCWSRIPAHLCERWYNRSVDDAKKEWKKVYREKGSDVKSNKTD